MALITDTLASFIEDQSLTRASLLVALSGGVDSVVLLSALSALRSRFPQLSLSAVHVHHGLQADADDWQSFCEALCKTLKVSLYAERVEITRAGGESLEACARKARYQVFERCLKKDQILCLAHHQNDQVETFLLQALRGAGLAGLASMANRQIFAQGELIRPLLQVSREAIISYARDEGLTYCHDASNDDERFRRNALRHRVMPALADIQPGALVNLSRAVSHVQEAKVLLDEYAESLLITLACDQGLNIERLKRLSDKQQALVIRYWLSRARVPMPTQAIMRRILADVLGAKPGAKPVVEWANAKLTRQAGVLRLESRA
ncbi:MAG: tRNA lysidine(34) synthetase TilS [Gammaproteobacteria bacterium CG11_big_fil_rev_8_21_14_0_20_46_22]|nr:MAG: tRNA lysidine(34) synthetase TilS [Gammaproteobacteria bacterium CG12_big_fil_rev_8_21_14_0_65_46_12]PIR10127.1 MAG: tRNA lysidine(34) synthetase TilS [Gammaproteobacteria bacterium CG11_big_fil_rev_8_21_14_0_20_46_22]